MMLNLELTEFIGTCVAKVFARQMHQSQNQMLKNLVVQLYFLVNILFDFHMAKNLRLKWSMSSQILESESW